MPAPDPAIGSDQPEPAAEPVGAAALTPDTAVGPAFEFAAPAATSAAAEGAGDDAKGEAVEAGGAASDDQPTIDAAEPAEAEASAGPIAGVAADIAADRPKRKGWWQKLVE